MPKLVWDQISEKLYETGTDRGVLYLLDSNNAYSKGVAWNGLTGVDENPSGAEPSNIYADNTKYIALYSAEEFGCTIRAYTYPEEFEECDGSAEVAPGIYAGQQNRKGFGFAYRTLVGNDTEGNDYGYKIHLVYGCKASPSAKTYNTINDSPDAIEFSWEVNTSPVPVPDLKPTSVFVIDTTKLSEKGKTKLTDLENILYGSDETVARLPLPEEIIDMFTKEQVDPDPVDPDPGE